MAHPPKPGSLAASWDCFDDVAHQIIGLRVSAVELQETADLAQFLRGNRLWPAAEPDPLDPGHPFGFVVFPGLASVFLGRKLPTRQSLSPRNAWVFFVQRPDSGRARFFRVMSHREFAAAWKSDRDVLLAALGIIAHHAGA